MTFLLRAGTILFDECRYVPVLLLLLSGGQRVFCFDRRIADHLAPTVQKRKPLAPFARGGGFLLPEYPEKEFRMPIPESKRLGVQELADLNERFESAPTSDVLAWVNGRFGAGAAQMSSFGLEDVALLDRFWRVNQQTRAYVDGRAVPYNELHNKNYPSIVCAPCTRAIEPGKDPRSGSWWWESDPNAKECGLHLEAPVARS